MPSLDFKGKSFIYTHHLGVPYRELLVVPKKSCVPEGKTPDLDDNLILHGDNLEALKALLPRYAGRVDCIYIDPPYNTGTEGWCYNDAVNAPLMREWLKKEGNPVERDDLQRHDKWLCMMWPRLQLLKDLLAEDGAIFVSIDDNEAHRLRAVMDEIFGEENFACCIPWQSRESVQNDTDISANHEFIVVYAKSRRQTERRLKESNAAKWYSMPGFTFFPLPLSKEKFANPDGDKRGLWKDDPFDAPGVRKNLEYQITNPKTGEIFLPPKGRHWRTEEENYHRLFQDDRIVFGKTGDSGPKLKVFYEEKCKFGEVATTWFPGSSYGTATSGTKELMEILGQGAFDYPKPTRLVVELLRLATDKDSLILDSFAGSGTTAHAVLALNAKDGGKRRFILCETEAYADTLTAERVRRVIRGYDYTGTQETELHPPEKLTWTTFAKDKNRNEILECIEGIESLERGNYDKIEKKITDGVLTITGQKQVKEKMPGLGGSFTCWPRRPARCPVSPRWLATFSSPPPVTPCLPPTRQPRRSPARK